MFNRWKPETAVLIDESDLIEAVEEENGTSLERMRNRVAVALEKLDKRREHLETDIATASEELRQTNVIREGLNKCLSDIEKGMKDDNS